MNQKGEGMKIKVDEVIKKYEGIVICRFFEKMYLYCKAKDIVDGIVDLDKCVHSFNSETKALDHMNAVKEINLRMVSIPNCCGICIWRKKNYEPIIDRLTKMYKKTGGEILNKLARDDFLGNDIFDDCCMYNDSLSKLKEYEPQIYPFYVCDNFQHSNAYIKFQRGVKLLDKFTKSQYIKNRS